MNAVTKGSVIPGAISVYVKFVPLGCTSPKLEEESGLRVAPSSLMGMTFIIMANKEYVVYIHLIVVMSW